jgi:hypothetical protein
LKYARLVLLRALNSSLLAFFARLVVAFSILASASTVALPVRAQDPSAVQESPPEAAPVPRETAAPKVVVYPPDLAREVTGAGASTSANQGGGSVTTTFTGPAPASVHIDFAHPSSPAAAPVGSSPQASTANTSASPPARFSLAAGLGYSFGDTNLGPSGLAGLAGLGSLGGASGGRAPFGTAALEFALSERFRFVLGVLGSYNRNLTAEPEIPGAGEKQWFFGASLGVRGILNPRGIDEVSPILAFGGYRTEIENRNAGSQTNVNGEMFPMTQDWAQRGIDTRLGLILEHALLPNLFLRFESYFMRLSWSKSNLVQSTEGAAEALTQSRSDLAVQYGFTPVLLLRLAF